MKKGNILVSLEPRFASAILNGSKVVELRRRRPSVLPGTTMWIYSKLPVGSIVGFATIEGVHDSTPQQIWKKYGAKTAVQRSEFFTYFQDLDRATAILLKDAKPLQTPVGLAKLRELSEGFQPPQFFSDLGKRTDGILQVVAEAV